MVTVSIITPTYNRKHLIGETIDSVLAQDFSDYEMIIVDDGSGDNTREYISERYDDPRIKYLYQENKGQNFARNHGLQKSEGEFICFLDSDDLWPDGKLSRSLSIFRSRPEVDVVYGYEMIIDEQSKIIGKETIRHHSGKVTAELLVENFIGMSSTMVRAEKVMEIGGMDETISVADDFSLWLRLSRICNFYYLDEALSHYRVTEGQISNDTNARLESNLYIVTQFLKEFPDVVSIAEKRKAMCEFYSKRVRLLSANGKYNQALKEFCIGFYYNPKSALPWRALYRLFFPRNEQQ